MPQSPASVSSSLPSAPSRPHLDKFFAKVDPVRGRVIVAIDATASRQPTWDMAADLTNKMFAAVANGQLEIQLVYFRGVECRSSPHWMTDARSLSAAMAKITCQGGATQIQRVLEHVRKEDLRKKVNTCVLISDSCEESAERLYGAARELSNVPVFMFQEGENTEIAEIYQTIARITGGAYSTFDSGSAERLAELLKAVVVFAVGGAKALANENSEAARLLLTQIRKQ
jgi:hypothetical protein